MDDRLLKNLENLDQLVTLSDGAKGVRVILQYLPTLTEKSRNARRHILQSQFKQIADEVMPATAEVDLDSVSPSGQMVTGIVPVDQLEAVESELAKKDVRVTVDELRRIV